METRELYGFTLKQSANNLRVSGDLFQNVVTKRNDLDDEARLNLIVATVALKFTQSNSVSVAYDGQIVGTRRGPAVARALRAPRLRQRPTSGCSRSTRACAT